MNRILALAILLSSTVALARVDYTCFIPNEPSSAVAVTIAAHSMALRNQKEIIDTESWEVKTGKAVFDRKGVIGGAGKLKGRAYYSLNVAASEVLPHSGVSAFYVEHSLATGGRTLRPGFKGGLMTFVNRDKRYVDYVCYHKTL